MTRVDHSKWTWTQQRGDLVALLFIIALAAFFRFWQIDEIPPGLHYDEAFNNLYSLRISRGEMLPIFIPENNGEEPLHIYATALYFFLAGPTPIGGRLISALFGVVAVAVLYFLGVELFRDYGRRAASRIGLMAALLLAVWYWSFHYSRIGMEPNTVPMVAVLAALFVWRTRRTGYWRDAVLAGFFTALSLYTYPAGRTVPVLVGLIVAYHLIFERQLARRRLPQLGVALLVAIIAFLPLGLYFLQHPEWFILRIRQTTEATTGDVSPWGTLWQGTLAVLRGFLVESDINWRQNLPGRPMMDLVQFLFYLMGLGACLRRPLKAPHWLLLVWTGLAFLPTIMTEFPPHHGRSLSATLPLALTMALGVWLLCREIMQRSPSRTAGYVTALGIVAAAVIYSGQLAFDDYFNKWSQSPELFTAFDVGLRQVGEYANTIPPEEPIYLTPIPRDWYTLTFALDGRDQRLRSYNGRSCLVFPMKTAQTTHQIVIVEDRRSLDRLQSLFPQGSQVWHYDNPYKGRQYAVDFAIPPGQQVMGQPQFSHMAAFAEPVQLLGYDLEPIPAVPGQPLHLRLWWSVDAPLANEYSVFVHLLGETNPATGSPLWAQRDAQMCDNSYPAYRWHPGDMVIDDYDLNLPPDLPPGSYELQVGMYDWRTEQRLSVRSAAGSFANDAILLTTLQVEGQAPQDAAD